MGLMLSMPRYQCYHSHKVVQAAKIQAVDTVEHKIEIAYEGASGWVNVGEYWIDRHEPKAGGYFVLYDDGYTSASPPEAFESGYRPIPQE